MRQPWRATTTILLAAVAASCWAHAATALTCGPEPVTARSENSRFHWTARSKARANWRAKVPKMSALGPDFANWARAANPEEHCFSGPSGVICDLTATPCKD